MSLNEKEAYKDGDLDQIPVALANIPACLGQDLMGQIRKIFSHEECSKDESNEIYKSNALRSINPNAMTTKHPAIASCKNQTPSCVKSLSENVPHTAKGIPSGKTVSKIRSTRVVSVNNQESVSRKGDTLHDKEHTKPNNIRATTKISIDIAALEPNGVKKSTGKKCTIRRAGT